VTSYIEGYVARNIFWEYRLATELKSPRRKKRKDKWPTHLPMRVDFGDRIEEMEVPIKDHQSSLLLPVYSMPAILDGKASTENWETFKFISWGPQNQPWKKMPGAKRVTQKKDLN